jgi:hypothetical protein
MKLAPEPIVAVWYHGLAPAADDDQYAILDVFEVIYRLRGDLEEALAIVREGKGVVCGPVFQGAGQIAAHWIESVGGVAFADDEGHYDS